MTERLSADLPIRLPTEDRLGYSNFARAIARAIRESAPSAGIVLALHGPWGSGKSTVLALIEHYLEHDCDGDTPIIIHFNPWWFSGRDDLLRRFFEQIIAKFASHGEKFKKLREKFAALAGLVGSSPVPFADWIKSVGEFVKPEESTVHDLRKSVEGLLEGLGAPVVVVVDDIDRLSLPEIRDLFRLVKAVANFPNVIYLLAFDRTVVSRALAGEFGESGDDYLEKIVQVPFELPSPDKEAIWRILFERVDKAIHDTPSHFFSQEHWLNVFHDLVAGFVETPRDAIRLANAVSVTYPPVREEVNAVDFIALETLRLFIAPVYAVIRDNPERFAGPSPERGAEGKGEQAFHDRWLTTIPEPRQEHVKDGLMRIFPRLESIWGNMVWGSKWEPDWKRAGRICSRAVFPTFFALQLGEGLFSRSRLLSTLSSDIDTDKVTALLGELTGQRRPDGTRYVRHFLSAVHEYASDLSAAQAKGLLLALSQAGDEVIRGERDERGFLDIPIFWTLRTVVYLLTQRLPAQERSGVLSEAISGGAAVCFIATSFGLMWDPGKRDLLVDAGVAAKIKDAVLARLRQGADQGVLQNVTSLDAVLAQWEELATPDEVRDWIEAQISHDAFFVKLCSGYTTITTSITQGDRFATKRRQLAAESLFRMVDQMKVGALASKLLAESSWADEDKELLELVSRAAATYKKGEDPIEESANDG